MGVIVVNPYSLTSWDPVTAAWLAQLNTSFGTNPSGPYVAALDAMIVGMRADGDLLELDRFWIFAQEVQSYARVSIVNPTSTQITEVNSPTWTANQGYTGNGTTQFLRSNFTYSTQAVKTQRANISHGVYLTTNTAGSYADAGVSVAANQITIYSRWGDGKAYGNANMPFAGTQASVAVANSLGMYSAQRTSSTGHDLLKNGSVIATAAGAENALPALEDYILAQNQTIGALPSPRRIAMRFIGSGAINHLDFYNRFQTFATSIGFNV